MPHTKVSASPDAGSPLFSQFDDVGSDLMIAENAVMNLE
jgi:hypothetical protein